MQEHGDQDPLGRRWGGGAGGAVCVCEGTGVGGGEAAVEGLGSVELWSVGLWPGAQGPGGHSGRGAWSSSSPFVLLTASPGSRTPLESGGGDICDFVFVTKEPQF